MSRISWIIAAYLAVVLSGCDTLRALQFKPDNETSGKTENQQFKVTYLRPLRLVESGTIRNSIAGHNDLLSQNIPDSILNLCGIEDTQKMAVATTTLPFVIAVGQIAFDVVTGAVDSRLEEIKKAAEKRYSAVVVTKDLLLRPEAYVPASRRDCVIAQRYTNKNLAMTLVHVAERHSQVTPSGRVTPNAKALEFIPAYLHVALAAAQTSKVKSGKPNITVTGTLSVAAIQPNQNGGGDEVKLIVASPFNFGGINIGVRYINPLYIEDKKILDEDDTEPLVTSNAPLFVPLESSPTVGAISVAIVERGSAATLDELSATEKSIRASIRGAIGSSIKEALTD